MNSNFDQLQSQAYIHSLDIKVFLAEIFGKTPQTSVLKGDMLLQRDIFRNSFYDIHMFIL